MIRLVGIGIVGMAVILLSSACSDKLSSTTKSKTVESQTKAGNAYTILAEKLRTPWSIQFDEETVYVSEREGSIVKISNGSVSRQKVKLNKPLKVQGEGGFLGIQLAPDFQKSRQAYAYHTYEEGGKIFNRVIVLQEINGEWKEIKSFLEGIPSGQIHNGGRLAIGPDNMLYMTTGDSGVDKLAQDLNSSAGKILRMTLDGKVPSDNPFAKSYVYSYGHRNSQGIAWDKQGRMFSSEHGPSGNPGGHDEINLIEKGNNYGWPVIIGNEKKEGMVTPLYQTGDTAIAPSGIDIDADGQILIATLVGKKLYRFNPDTKQMAAVLEGEGRLRDVRLHNGDIYVLTNNTDGRGSPSASDDRLLMLKK
ncbi:PQQ-dependent sugar dehydrogenase [Paenibacillus anseongensis]|nr:PQQ-dependent sugar dehydrogenase [Paenibacillus sp. CGMCC 1.16610]